MHNNASTKHTLPTSSACLRETFFFSRKKYSFIIVTWSKGCDDYKKKIIVDKGETFKIARVPYEYFFFRRSRTEIRVSMRI